MTPHNHGSEPSSSEDGYYDGGDDVDFDQSDNSDISDDGSSDNSDSDSMQDNGELRVANLLDIEAEEDDDDDLYSDVDGSGRLASNDDDRFPFFTKLPPEIRHQIWQNFCPDLVPKPRVLRFAIQGMYPFEYNQCIGWLLHSFVGLEDQTRTLRTVMEVHSESRAFARSIFPHDFPFQDNNTLAYHKQRDIIMLEKKRNIKRNDLSDENLITWDFIYGIVNMAIDYSSIDGLFNAVRDSTDLVAWLPRFGNLKRVYLARSDEIFKEKKLTWCVADTTHQYVISGFDEDVVEQDVEKTKAVICWPDVDGHPDATSSYASPDPVPQWLTHMEKSLHRRELQWLRMVIFQFDSALDRYEALLTRKKEGTLAALNVSDSSDLENEFNSSGSEDLGPYPSEQSLQDHYTLTLAGESEDESEDDDSFIDDSEIVEQHDDSSDIDDLDLAEESSTTMTGQIVSSSPAPEPDSDQESAQATPRRRVAKRKIISDDESDMDEQADAPRGKRPRARRAVDSDSESERQPSRQDSPSDCRFSSLSAASQSESDSDELEQTEQRGPSLLDRLAAANQAMPPHASDENDSEADQSSQDSLDSLDGREDDVYDYPFESEQESLDLQDDYYQSDL